MLRRVLVGLGILVLVPVVAIVGYSLSLDVVEAPLYTIEHAIEIDAPPDRVWAVLSDFDAYPEWNPYAVSIEGTAAFDERLVVTLVQDDWEEPLVVTPTVIEWGPGDVLGWQGRVLLPGVHDTFHRWELTRTSAGTTRLRQSEDFHGWLARLVPAPEDRPAIRRAFRAMNEALKARVETGR